jgi:hypothetical protein
METPSKTAREVLLVLVFRAGIHLLHPLCEGCPVKRLLPVTGLTVLAILGGSFWAKPSSSQESLEKSPKLTGPAPTPAERQQQIQKFMRKKLGASNRILEGLTTENSDLVKSGAEELNQMSNAELWRVSKDPIYRQFSEDFQRVTKSLGESAQGGDLDKSFVRWIDVTMQCIDCHRFVRDKLIAAPNGSPTTPGKL